MQTEQIRVNTSIVPGSSSNDRETDLETAKLPISQDTQIVACSRENSHETAVFN